MGLREHKLFTAIKQAKEYFLDYRFTSTEHRNKQHSININLTQEQSNMVSPLSSRLIGFSGDSSNSSRGSSQKRPLFASQLPIRPESSISGYSADREEPSVSPPVVSIDLLSSCQKNANRDTDACPKRRKRNELEFAAASVKADLARAGIEYTEINKNIEKTTCLKDISISLKGVQLIHSNDFKSSLVTSSISGASSIYDYQLMARSCRDAYPHGDLSQLKSSKSFAESQDSDRSTSSVSDTESDSGSSNGNLNQTTVLFLPPLLDDSFETSKASNLPLSNISGSCNIISCSTNAVTMGEAMQLSTTARYGATFEWDNAVAIQTPQTNHFASLLSLFRLVVSSCTPYPILHANAAFFRFSGMTPSAVLGASFTSLQEQEEAESNQRRPLSLPECMVSSSSGNNRKFVLVAADDAEKPIQCRIKVSPIVARKTETSEVTSMTHFAIDFVEDGESPDANIHRPLTGADLAVGVMG